jgi:hypothetical protein
MGEIFGGSQCVHVWLGKTSSPQRVEQMLSDPAGAINRLDRRDDLRRNLHLLGQHILHNEYWNRAWVVQEIFLAPKVIVFLDVLTYTLSEFVRRVHLLDVDLTGTPFEQFDVGENQSLRESIRNTSLLFLLHRFRNKRCVIPHDRIFSLLSICHEDDRVDVDYNVHWTQLAIAVLSKSKHSLCVCFAALVVESLVSPGCNIDTDHPAFTVVLSFEVSKLIVGRTGSLTTPDTHPSLCVGALRVTVNALISRTPLGPGLKRVRQYVPGDSLDLSTALRDSMDLEENQQLWQHYPTDISYH